MTLLELVSALNDKEVSVIVKDGDTVLIDFMSPGIQSVSSDVSGRIVKEWYLKSASEIAVELNPVET